MSKVIPLRVSDGKWAEYAQAAQAEGVGLSTYLKARLEQSDDILEQISELRRGVEFATQSRSEAPARAATDHLIAPTDRGLLIEAVLLLRSVVSADKLGMVHGELERQGIKKWTPEKSG